MIGPAARWLKTQICTACFPCSHPARTQTRFALHAFPAAIQFVLKHDLHCILSLQPSSSYSNTICTACFTCSHPVRTQTRFALHASPAAIQLVLKHTLHCILSLQPSSSYSNTLCTACFSCSHPALTQTRFTLHASPAAIQFVLKHALHCMLPLQPSSSFSNTLCTACFPCSLPVRTQTRFALHASPAATQFVLKHTLHCMLPLQPSSSFSNTLCTACFPCSHPADSNALCTAYFSSLCLAILPLAERRTVLFGNFLDRKISRLSLTFSSLPLSHPSPFILAFIAVVSMDQSWGKLVVSVRILKLGGRWRCVPSRSGRLTHSENLSSVPSLKRLIRHRHRDGKDCLRP
jgi:hypothetical protein